MPSKYSHFVTEREKKRLEERLKKKNKMRLSSPSSKESKKSLKENDLVRIFYNTYLRLLHYQNPNITTANFVSLNIKIIKITLQVKLTNKEQLMKLIHIIN